MSKPAWPHVTTYISARSTFADFELKDGKVGIHHNGFAVRSGNDQLGGVHRQGRVCGADDEDKMEVYRALWGKFEVNGTENVKCV